MLSFLIINWLFFAFISTLAFLLQCISRPQIESSEDRTFALFQQKYLLVYWSVMFGDWLQGPYVYELYASYGFTHEMIAVLFIGGFGSSALFGTFLGSIADKFGRKRMSIYCGVIYATSCLTKLFPNFFILMIGRVLAGIATSLLFSVFEAWMVHEHFHRNFHPTWLGYTFSIGTFGNGLAAILAGIVASTVTIYFGYVSSFMVAMVLFIGTSLYIHTNWEENYGDATVSIGGVFSGALSTMRSDLNIFLLGLTQSLFEGSIYVFVFWWTPMLKESFEDYKDRSLGLHGITFASFMVMTMLGSTVFVFTERKFSVEFIYLITLASSALTYLAISIVPSGPILFVSFMLIELFCGIHWTCIGILRGKYIPEETRSAVMNFFRLPLNLLVCLILYNVDKFSSGSIFLVCSCWLVCGTIGQFYIFLHRKVNLQNR